MKVLLDQGLPRSTATLLRARGIDALHVAEIGLSAAADAVILEQGRTDERTIVTLDADFTSCLLCRTLPAVGHSSAPRRSAGRGAGRFAGICYGAMRR